MTAAVNALKGQLKLDPKLSAIMEEGKKDNMRGKQKKNKKNMNFCLEQKRDKVWKKEPLKEGNKKEKKVGKYTYHWCKHHMALTASLGRGTKRSRMTILPLLLLPPPWPSIHTSLATMADLQNYK
jgi:hypothetical protein